METKASQEFRGEYFNMTGNVDVERFNQLLSNDLARSQATGTLRPKKNAIKVFYVDDLHMCGADEFGIKAPLELMRTYIDHEGWYNQVTKAYQKVKNLQVCATVSVSDEPGAKYTLNERLHWHFAMITFVNFKNQHLKEIYT